MPHIEAYIEINPLSQELISDFLILELGFGGVVLEEKIYQKTDDIDSLPNANEAAFDDKGAVHIIKAYCEELKMSEELLKQKILEKRNELVNCGISEQSLGSWNSTFSKIEDDSWSTNWMQHWDVQKIGERTVICPSWLEHNSLENEVVISLDPGAAFGTGTHPTTRLCISALEKIVEPDSTIADIGCGSGILAIASKKYGASNVVGVDIDETSIDVANENAQKNNVDCAFHQGSASDVEGQYSIVIANILAHIIIDILPDLKKLMSPSGVLLLSGIIEEKKDNMLSELNSLGLKVEKMDREDEWISLLVRA